MNGRIGRWLLFLGTLGFAVIGQYYFAKKPDYFWDGVAFYAVAVILLLMLVRQRRGPGVRAASASLVLTRDLLIRGGLIAVGLFLALLVVIQLTDFHENYWPIFWLWIAAMGLYLLGFARLGREQVANGKSQIANQKPEIGILKSQIAIGAWWGRLRRRLETDGWEWGLVALLLIAAFVLRAWHIDTIPWTLGGDEGSQGLWARDVIEGRLPNMFGTGWLSVPNLSFFWQAGWFQLLGDNVTGLRMPWAMVGTMTVLGVYLLVRRLFDRRLALLTAFLLATYHFHIHYSRLGSNQVADPLFVVWALYFLVVGWQGKRRWAWAASGVVAGLAFYFYAGSRQVPVILIAVLAWAAVTHKDFLQEHRYDLWAMLGGFVVAVGPMALFFFQHPADFNARLNQVGIFQSGWLEREIALTGRSKWNLLAEQFRKAFFAFNFFKDRVVWYGASIPLMAFWASIFFLLGAVLSVSRLGKWRYAVFVIWFGIVMTTGGALTENPPSSQRLVSSAAPAVFFVAIALRELTRVLRDLLALPELGRRIMVGGVALALALISVRFYFGPYQESWTYGSFNGEVATRIGYYLRDLGPEWEEYFFGAPRMYADFGSTPFIAKGIALYDVRQPLTGPPTFVDPNHSSVFIFLPERMGELALVQQAYPDGILEEVHRIDDPDGPLLYVAYKAERR